MGFSVLCEICKLKGSMDMYLTKEEREKDWVGGGKKLERRIRNG